MKAVHKAWFTGRFGAVGIVVGEDETTGKREAYLGLISGHHEELDIQIVLDWGARLLPDHLDEIRESLSPPTPCRMCGHDVNGPPPADVEREDICFPCSSGRAHLLLEAVLPALRDIMRVIEVDELVPESVSYMQAARAALATAKEYGYGDPEEEGDAKTSDARP